jgi:uncharacterized glyoxalase superfamily protein PhnB
MPLRPAIIPCLVYSDAHAAIDFLCSAFGFARHAVYESEDGRSVDHAQLTIEGNMIMLSSHARHSEERLGLVPPSRVGGKVTACIYVVLADPDAHHARAAAAGAEIVTPPRDQDFGRTYEARDCEGNVWSFGSYDPFELFADA